MLTSNGRPQEDQAASAGAAVIIAASSPLQYPSSDGRSNNLAHGAILIAHPSQYHPLPASPNSSRSTTVSSATGCGRSLDAIATCPSPAHLHFPHYSSLLARNGLYPLPHSTSANPSPSFSRSNAPSSPAPCVEHKTHVDSSTTEQIRPHPASLIRPTSPHPYNSSSVSSISDCSYMLPGRPQPHISRSCSSAAPSPDDCSRNSTSSSDSHPPANYPHYKPSPRNHHLQYEFGANAAKGSTSSSRGAVFEKSKCTSTVVAACSQTSTTNCGDPFAVRGAGEETGYGYGQEKGGDDDAAGGLKVKVPMGSSYPMDASQRGAYPKPTRELVEVPMQEQIATSASKQDPSIKPAAASHNMQSPSHPSNLSAKIGAGAGAGAGGGAGAGAGHSNPLHKSAPNPSTFKKLQLGNQIPAQIHSSKNNRKDVLHVGDNCQNYYQCSPSPPPCSNSNSSSARTSNGRKYENSVSGNHKHYSYIARSPRSPDALLGSHQQAYADTIKPTSHPHPPIVNNTTSKKWDDAEKWITANISGCKGFTSNTLRMLGKSCNESTVPSLIDSPIDPSHRCDRTTNKSPSSTSQPSLQNSVGEHCVQYHGPPDPAVDAQCGIANYASMARQQINMPTFRDHAVRNADSPMAVSHETYQPSSQEGHGTSLVSYCNCLKVNHGGINWHHNPTNCEANSGSSSKPTMVSDTRMQHASGLASEQSIDDLQVHTHYHETAMLDGCSSRHMVRSTSASSSTAGPGSQNRQLSDHPHHLPRLASNSNKLPHCANCGSCSWITPSRLLQKGCEVSRPGMDQADSLNPVWPLLHHDNDRTLLQHVPLRDVSTEMTPLEGSSMTTSRYPSKCASPSRHNTPARQMRALLQHGSSSSILRNNCHSVDLTELAKCHRAKLELHALTWNERGERIRSFHRSTSNWSSREAEEDDLSRSLRHADIDEDQSKSSWEKKDTQFKEERLEREEARIQAWENQKKAKADAQIRKLEAKLEKQRSQTTDKIMSKLLVAQRQAEEMRANVRSQKKSTKAFGVRHKSHSPISRCACFSSKVLEFEV